MLKVTVNSLDFSGSPPIPIPDTQDASDPISILRRLHSAGQKRPWLLLSPLHPPSGFCCPPTLYSELFLAINLALVQ